MIIGIDPSLTGTGVVALSTDDLYTELIKSKPSGEKPIDELLRIKKIVCKVMDFIQKYDGIKLVVMEALAMNSRNSSALTQLSGLNYLLRNELYEKTLPFIIVAPTSLKKFITGKGNCPKELILMEVYKHYGKEFRDNNLADAYGLAKTGEALLDKNIKLNKQQQEVINLLEKQL
jgi:crossover junction endodeoxyribonuclease RuvC